VADHPLEIKEEVAVNLSERLSQLVLLGALCYLPFRQLVGRILEQTDASERIIFLSQILPELLILGGIMATLLRSRPAHPPRLTLLALTLLAWSFVTALYHPQDLGQGWIGIRHDFIGLLALLLVWLQLPAEEGRQRLVRVTEWGIGLLAVVGLLQFAVGPTFSDWLGYYSHHVGKIPQVHSLLYSPNQLASLMVVGAALVFGRASTPASTAMVGAYGLILGATHSRSAMIGAMVLGAGYLIHQRTRRSAGWQIDYRPLILGAALIVGIAGGMLRYGEGWRAVILHGESTQQHLTANTTALTVERESFWPLLIGSGIGTAGPASFRTEEPRIAESWYLQLIQEIGLAGLALYLALVGFVTWSLFRIGETALGWLALALSANALFLHTWADNYYLNIAFWSIVGLAVFGATKKANTR
jgi:hypothetical protein